jgi:PRTRC genetic system protein E
MFKELSPILATRGIILTLGTVKDDRIRVTVTPRPKGKDDPKELSQPFVVEGTAEELDAELPKAIETYACAILTLERSLQQLKENTDAALAEAKKEADKKVAEAKNKNKPASKTPTKVEAKPEPPSAPAPPSLFDTPAEGNGEAQPATPAVAAETTTTTDDSDPEPDTDPDGSDDDSDDTDDANDEVGDVSVQGNNIPVSTPPVAIPISQPSMFDSPRDKEAEILEEAFGHGPENSLIAA